MNLFAGLEAIVKENEPMAPRTWFKLGGPARYFVEPRGEQELLEVVRRCHENSVEMYVLGRGSNLLVADAGVSGVVIHLTNENFGKIEIEDTRVRVGAGADLRHLLMQSARSGLSGLECMVGIPGSVGGAVKINAGGSFGDIGNVAQSVRLLDSSGFGFVREREDIYFGYRMTNIMAKFILEVELMLVPDDPERIGRQIKEIWMLKRNSQPISNRSAGCIFKNPRSLSAGALIDKAGLKGYRIGGAYVSERHANFILADEGAKSSDVLELIEVIREKVRERYEIELELEIDIWR
ncbi:MAG: UDP-N-acetylenolpyruvoylglucosamine reductase [Planctomycetes bacterium ADurb.Bin412]|nr:MAG: UDP-N-acetylenolpyruvoylglucosamine reductase [Planctomycetes bacterium ADurb.Bin412]